MKLNEFERDILGHHLKTMDVPHFRRDFTQDTNVRWLLRNLGIRNRDNPHFRRTMELLKILAKG